MPAHLKVKCNSCGGIFLPVQANGMLYFHVCPDGTPEPRNENISQGWRGGPVGIMAAGKGVTALGPVGLELPAKGETAA